MNKINEKEDFELHKKYGLRRLNDRQYVKCGCRRCVGKDKYEAFSA